MTSAPMFVAHLAPAAEYSLWSTTPIGTVEENDTMAVTLGTVFRTSVDGGARGIRWQRAAGSAGVSEVALFQGATNLSGIVAVTGQASSGWCRQDFGSDIAITSGTLYCVAAFYDSTDPMYSAASEYFASGHTVGPLEGVAAAVSPNGLYTYAPGSLSRPTSSFENSSYFIDIVFVP